MLILSAAQTRAADALTVQSQSLTSLELMERAATAIVEQLLPQIESIRPPRQTHIIVCCGSGNNGGDGLAVARLLIDNTLALQRGVTIYPPLSGSSLVSGFYMEDIFIGGQPIVGARQGVKMTVYYLQAEKYSSDWLANRERLPVEIDIKEVQSVADFPLLNEDSLVIDALFGTGLTRPLDGLAAELVRHLNASDATIVSIDLPSGLPTDTAPSPESAIIRATRTLTLGAHKLPLFLPEASEYVGNWEMLDIGLDLSQTTTTLHFTTAPDLAPLLAPRARFAHKGTYGHALLLAGSRGKLGAAVLAARACLRSGVGLLTVHVPAVGYGILQTGVPEAMTTTDPMADHLSALADDADLGRHQALGFGPGIGQHADTALLLRELLADAKARDLPVVLDADALNLLAQHPQWLNHLPARTVLTPHPKEFERLVGPTASDFERLDRLKKLAADTGAVVLLKGAYSVVAAPDGMLYFNSTGNPGMATGGTGDVLTGVVLGLLAQGLAPLDAARLGAFIHGRAGDMAAHRHGERGLIAGDVVEQLGVAFAAKAAPDPLDAMPF